LHLRSLILQLSGRMDYGHPLELSEPFSMPRLQEQLNFLPVQAIPHLLIVKTICRVLGGVDIGMGLMPTTPATERLLRRPIVTGDMMTDMAFLRTVGTLDLLSTLLPFQGTPADLLRDVG